MPSSTIETYDVVGSRNGARPSAAISAWACCSASKPRRKWISIRSPLWPSRLTGTRRALRPALHRGERPGRLGARSRRPLLGQRRASRVQRTRNIWWRTAPAFEGLGDARVVHGSETASFRHSRGQRARGPRSADLRRGAQRRSDQAAGRGGARCSGGFHARFGLKMPGRSLTREPLADEVPSPRVRLSLRRDLLVAIALGATLASACGGGQTAASARPQRPALRVRVAPVLVQDVVLRDQGARLARGPRSWSRSPPRSRAP